jgi:hypothetical protein
VTYVARLRLLLSCQWYLKHDTFLGASNIHNIYMCCQMHLAAAALKFEDNEQQKRYVKISFREIQDEVKELKVR